MMSSVRKADYQGAGFAGRLGMGSRPALVVVDLMVAYFDHDSPMYARVEHVLDRCLRLIDIAATSGVPVIVTRQVFEGPEDGIYVRKVPALKLLRPSSPLAGLHPSVRDRQADVLVKHFPSAFYRTDLAERLRQLAVDTPIVCGLTTSGCIRATAMDCLLHDFRGTVVRDCVGDRDIAAHEANLFDIDNKLADVVDLTSVVDAIAQRR
jgi:nicotinamidase-related amidase